ncbi:BNR-4 repeat-containing protein, partial [Thermococcus sp.]|uniref:BNR-4 repeat-containing protein n=1 Tax=Thermococcus sp. TaxID=35749 RepID=UPI0026389DBE
MIAIDGNDNVHVVWRGTGWGTNTGYHNIQYRKRTSTGWQSQEAVTDKDADQVNPSIAIDSDGNVHVVWFGKGWGANTTNWNLQYRKKTSSGWKPREAITDKNADQTHPVIAIDKDDNVHVVWRGLGWGTNTGYYNIQYRKRTSSGWQTREGLTDVAINQYFPNLIWALYPLIGAVRTNRPEVGYAFVWTDGTTIKFYKSDDFTITTILFPKWQYRKKLTINGSSGAGTNYQVLLKVGESSGASGCDFHVEGHSANFPSDTNQSGDLRFTDNDGITLLSFWVEKVEG